MPCPSLACRPPTTQFCKSARQAFHAGKASPLLLCCPPPLLPTLPSHIPPLQHKLPPSRRGCSSQEIRRSWPSLRLRSRKTLQCHHSHLSDPVAHPAAEPCSILRRPATAQPPPKTQPQPTSTFHDCSQHYRSTSPPSGLSSTSGHLIPARNVL